MKRFFLGAAASLTLLAGCVTPEQSTLLGAATGAAAGYAVSSDADKTKGALVGAAAGAIAGTLLGNANQPGKCRYRDANGNIFIANCP
jgi:outer membrane lipoprotein SlyB